MYKKKYACQELAADPNLTLAVINFECTIFKTLRCQRFIFNIFESKAGIQLAVTVIQLFQTSLSKMSYNFHKYSIQKLLRIQ